MYCKHWCPEGSKNEKEEEEEEEKEKEKEKEKEDKYKWIPVVVFSFDEFNEKAIEAYYLVDQSNDLKKENWTSNPTRYGNPRQETNEAV